MIVAPVKAELILLLTVLSTVVRLQREQREYPSQQDRAAAPQFRAW